MAKCRSCDAPIEWAVSEKGRRMPMDAEPVADGTFLLSHCKVGEPPVAVHQSEAERETLAKQAAARGEELRLFRSHFASCPNASGHRR